MSSLSIKSDKCAILQETVDQIRRIKQESEQSDELQQSEVSSSKPTILANDVLGLLLLEALDGFFFVVNTDGKIEFVSENVTSFLKYRQDDLVGKSVYNIIHLGDHARFSSNLLPMSIGNGFAWTSDLCVGSSKSRTFNCRFLIKPPDDQDETMEEKQTRVPQYENTQISAVSLPCHGDKPDSSESASELQNCLVCVARRIPATEKNFSMVVEQFNTRLDLTGKILSIDTSGVSSTYSQYLNKDLVGKIIQEVCHPSDLSKVNQHLKDTLQTGSNTSGIYRFRVTKEKYILIQSKSKRVVGGGQLSNDKEFVMATHSIISDSSRNVESNPLNSNSSNSGVNSRLSPVPSTSTANNNSISLVSLNGVTTSSSSSTMPASSSVASYSTFHALSPPTHDFSSLNDLALDIFPSSSWDLGSSSSNPTGSGTTANNSFMATSSAGCIHTATTSIITTTSGNQQQPSSSAFSPDQFRTPASPCPSPVTQLSSTSSPGGVSAGQGFSSGYPFSPMAPSSGKTSPLQKEDSYRSGSRSPATSLLPDSQAATTTSATTNTSTTGVRATQKLRDLLTQGMEEADSSKMDSMDIAPSSSASSEGEVGRYTLGSRNENTILRELLNQEDEDMNDFGSATKMAQKLGDGVKVGAHSSSVLSSLAENCKNEGGLDKKNMANNNMLRKLLNNDDEGDKNYRKSQDLLQQLLKAESPEKVTVDPSSSGGSPAGAAADMSFQTTQQQQQHHQQQHQHSSLVVKRKSSEDPADGGSCESTPKRPVTIQGQGRALLAGQNPMLASMLAQTPRTLPSVPTSIANSIISQLPQERLPKNLEKKLIHTPLPGGGVGLLPPNLQQLLGPMSSQVPVASGLPPPPPPPPPPSHTATSVASNIVMGAGPPSQGIARQQPQNNMVRGILSSSNLQQQHQDLAAEVRTHLAHHQQQQFAQQQQHQQQGFLSKILSGSDSNSTQQQLARFQQRVGLVGQAAAAVAAAAQQQLNLPEILGDPSSSDSGPSGNALAQNTDPLLSEILDQVLSMQQITNLEAHSSSSTSTSTSTSCTSEEAALLKYLDEVLEPHMQAAAAAASSSTATSSSSSPSPSQSSASGNTQSPSISSSATSQDVNERMAISAIQRQLMSFEVPISNSSSLPAYSQDQRQHVTVHQTQAQGAPGSSMGYPYQGQPPAYSNTLVSGQRPQRIQASPGLVQPGTATIGHSNQLTIQRVGGLLQQYGAIAATVSPQMRRSLLERRQQLFLQAQQQNKKRLIAQQQQQQLTMQTQQPTIGDSLGPPSTQGLYTENMTDLLNNTIAPNVTLQRTTSLPDQQQQQASQSQQQPQLSPRYSSGGGTSGLIGHTQQLPSPQPPPAPSQLSPGQRTLSQSPFSPLSQSFPSPTQPPSNPSYPGSVQAAQQHRLSPHPLPNYPGQGPSPSPISSGGGPRSPHLSQLSPQPSTSSTTPQWSQRGAPPSPVGANLQQQNPMLNAQLSQQTSYAAAAAAAAAAQARFTAPPQQRQLAGRSLPSPSPGSGSRSSPYAAQPDSPYHLPPSPGIVYCSSPAAPSASQQAMTSQTSQATTQQQQQQQRIQRALSMPGRVNSPRTSQAGPFLTAPVVASNTTGSNSEPLLSPQPSPSSFSQSLPCTPAVSSTFSAGPQQIQQQGTPVYTLAQENSHFSFEQQMFPHTTSNERSRPAGGAVSSEFVKQELRAMVGARTQQQQQLQGQGPSQHLQQPPPPQQQQHTLSLNVPTPPSLSGSSNPSLDLDVLAGLQLDLVSGDGQPSSPSLFAQQQQSLLSIANSHEASLPSQTHNTNNSRVEEAKPSDQKKSLLQQLLSEPS